MRRRIGLILQSWLEKNSDTRRIIVMMYSVYHYRWQIRILSLIPVNLVGEPFDEQIAKSWYFQQIIIYSCSLRHPIPKVGLEWRYGISSLTIIIFIIVSDTVPHLSFIPFFCIVIKRDMASFISSSSRILLLFFLTLTIRVPEWYLFRSRFTTQYIACDDYIRWFTYMSDDGVICSWFQLVTGMTDVLMSNGSGRFHFHSLTIIQMIWSNMTNCL